MPNTYVSTPRRRTSAGAGFAWSFCAMLGLALTGMGSRDASAQPLRTPHDRCADVVPGGPIDYRNTKLLETADIKTPEIRRINALISARCYEAAAAAIEHYRSAAPEDHQIEFVENRMIWIMQGTDAAERAVAASLAKHPDFASVKVLRASIDIERKRYDDAARLLDEIAKSIPDDLWLMIDRMQIELRRGPKPDMPARLKDMMNNAQFPPSAREMSGLALLRLPDTDKATRATVYRTLLTFESATPFSRKAQMFADELVLESKGSAEDAVDIIGRAVADPRAASNKELRDLLAIAYLQKAATIDPTPTARNADLIARSVKIMDPYLMYQSLAYVPNGAALRPLIADRIDMKLLPENMREAQ